jgi:chemotaxis methyl-accepting protein methylase
MVVKQCFRDIASIVCRKYIGVRLSASRQIWNRLPKHFQRSFLGQAYGHHLHALVRRYEERNQSHATWFLRNRSELELMRHIIKEIAVGSRLNICVLACSRGAEVYSILWAIRPLRPDLKITTYAVDISQEIIDFAKEGVYSRRNARLAIGASERLGGAERLACNTYRDQSSRDEVSIFERMTADEIEAMFEIATDQMSVKSWLREGVVWLRGDAGDPDLVGVIGLQDMVVANRFLCHMEPVAAERHLRNISKLVKPGGHLFVTGIDLDVRTKVAKELGWKPVTDLIREIHEGDPSLTQGWPLGYWALEPFSDSLLEWRLRFASVFQIGEAQGFVDKKRPEVMNVSNELVGS